MSKFAGFPPELFTFFVGLERDNSKVYWEAHKALWETKVREPMQLLVAELEEEFPPLRLFRPNRDVRFSKDKTPYRLWAGITTSSRAAGGIGYFLRVQASGLRMACGTMLMESDQLERFRIALDHKIYSSEFEKICQQLTEQSLPVSSGIVPTLKRVPAGYPKDHPRAEYLRWKGVIVIKEFSKADWMSTPQALQKIKEVWHGAEPMKQWIDEHIGPSKVEPKRLK